ncbi:MAG: DUF655 domain-containing protein, partial [Cyanobacteria bacterium P01_F01_bin.42]
GSHNWSAAANRLNDETLIAIAHPLIAAHYQQEFERLYTNSRLGLPSKIQAQWEEFKSRCSREWSQASSSEESSDQVSLIDLNLAMQEELETLPGIGEKTAQAIMEARENQSFESLEDLDRVHGIGAKTLEKLRDRVTW